MSWLHRVNARLLGAFAVPLVALAVVGVLNYRNTDTLEANSGMVQHTYQVISGVDAARKDEFGVLGAAFNRFVSNATRDAIGRMSQIVEQVNDYQATIASAVEEQTATTSEMARNVTDASAGTRDIAGNLAGVATAAENTTAAITDTQQSVAELASMSSTLHGLVGQFKY